MDCLERAANLALRNRLVAKTNVASNRSSKELHILKHQPEQRPQLSQIDVPNVDTVEGNSALLNIVEAQQQADDRRLSRSSSSDDPDTLSRANFERYVLQYGLAFDIGEAHVLEANHAWSPPLPALRDGHGWGVGSWTLGVGTISTGVSSSPKMRSEEAIAP